MPTLPRAAYPKQPLRIEDHHELLAYVADKLEELAADRVGSIVIELRRYAQTIRTVIRQTGGDR